MRHFLIAFVFLFTTALTAQAAPTITSVSPGSGSSINSAMVTITGTNFVTGLTVTFGGVSAQIVSVGATTINATPGYHLPGPVDVIVTNPDLQAATLSGGYTYVSYAPVVTSVSPSSGPSTGGSTVTINGDYFNYKEGTPQVLFGGLTATLRSASVTALVVDTPGHSAGAVNVVVRNPDLQSATLTNGYTFVDAPPTISSVNPSAGSSIHPAQITISGNNFRYPGNSITVGGVQAQIVSSGTNALVVTPGYHLPGQVDVIVTNPDLQTATLPGGFTYVSYAPVVTSISPSSGSSAGGNTVTVNGDYFNYKEGTPQVLFDGLSGTVRSASDSTLMVDVPAHAAGVVNIVVKNPDLQSATLTNAYTFVDAAPAISGVSPSSGSSINAAQITISGSNFRYPGNSVTVGGVQAQIVSSGTNALVVTPGYHLPGVVDIVVTNPGGLQTTLPGGYTYVSYAPVITSVSPSSGASAGGNTVTINGDYFNYKEGAPQVLFDGVVGVLRSASVTALVLDTPAHPPGVVNVVVKNPDQQTATLVGAFTYGQDPAPVVANVSPTSGTVVGGDIVTISGDHFGYPGNHVYFDTIEAQIRSDGGSTFQVVTPPHAAGSVSVSVKNPDGQSSLLSSAFTYVEDSPQITKITPESGSSLGGNIVRIEGDRFVYPGVAVTFGGISVQIRSESRTALEFIAPSHSPGLVDIVVTNPNRLSVSRTGAYTYLSTPPVISSVTPGSGPTYGSDGERNLVMIYGRYFAFPGATVRFGGAAAIVRGTGDSSIQVYPPAHLAGTVDVTVTNSDGQAATLPQAYTYTAFPPRIDSIFPTSGSTSGGEAITIAGEFFVYPGVKVRVDGTLADLRATGTAVVEFVAPAHAEGPADITVINPDGQSSTVKGGYYYGKRPASLVVTSFPTALAVTAGDGSTATTSYAITNLGERTADVTLTNELTGAPFFVQVPERFSLAPGGSQTVSITSIPQPNPMSASGFSVSSGAAGETPTRVEIRLVSSAPVGLGIPNIVAVTTRVDVAAPTGTNPTGTITYRNDGTRTATGILSSDADWLIPQSAVVQIDSGATVSASFRIDRTRQPDAGNPSGSLSANIRLVYPFGSTGTSRSALSDPSSLAGAVTTPVTDTRQTATKSDAIPPLANDEVAVMISGVGHVIGSGGKEFISDVSILNTLSATSVPDAKLYFSSPNAVVSASQPVNPAQGLQLSDVVNTFFKQGTSSQGTMHIRSRDSSKLSVSANVFNKSNLKGTYGTAIPVFRSNRVIGSGERLVLTGLRKDATAHTNLYLQEMSGSPASAHIEFFDENGASKGSLDSQVSSFNYSAVGPVVPVGAVMATITNTSGGKLQAYATPVDDASGDTWAVADWDRQYGLSGSEAMLIPVAGFVSSNGANFRTDIAITNIGSGPGSVTLTYYPRGASEIVKTVSLGANQTRAISDVTETLFEVAGTSLGAIAALPASGTKFAITSRTYTASPGDPATYGTGVPTLPLSSALKAGQSQLFGGIEDVTLKTQLAKAGGTFRTNLALFETTGQPVTLRVTLFFSDGKNLVGGGASGTQTYSLNPHQFLQLNGLVRQILGTDIRDSAYGDLHNVQVKVEILSGSGAVVPFITATDNGTSDTVLRTE